MDCLTGLNDRQREAVVHNGTPLLILAGAGSGKTRVITTKIAFLIEEMGADPRSILAVTFTNKAAGEMKQRAVALSPAAAYAEICTFHSFGARFLRRYGESAGLRQDFNIIDDGDAVTLLSRLFPEYKKDECRAVYNAVQRAKDAALEPTDDLTLICDEPRFPDLYEAYQNRLKEINCADFGDLILRPLHALRQSEILRKKIQNRYKIILVDEYQDSNTAQFRLLQAMKGDDTYLCVVGDEDQSIYAFRGAEVGNILTFADCFPGTETIRLEQNYRSAGRILKAADSVISHNKQRLGKTLWTASSEEGICELRYFDDERAEAEFCVEILSDGKWEGSAVLYRTNAQASVFEQLFRQKGIPYTTLGTPGFFERKEIKDALAFLRLLLNPSDVTAFERIVNRPARGVGEKKMQKIVQESVRFGNDLIQTAASAAETDAKGGALMHFCGLFGQVLSNEDFSIGETITFFFKESGLFELYAKEDGGFSDREENIKALIDLSARYGRGRDGLRLFLDSLALDTSFDTKEKRSGVNLATIHNTKGLEFDRVFITGVEDGILPSTRTENIEEERRLFYVAVTRARHALYITSAASRFRFGRSERQMPSPFLAELDKEAVDVFGRKTDEEGTVYPAGAVVEHEKYGQGRVLRSVRVGSQTVVHIMFADGIVRQILPKYTRLELIAKNGYEYDW